MEKKIRKKPRTLPYPDPKDDPETKNRKLRNLRAINVYGKEPVDIRNVGNSQSAYNREQENKHRRDFKDIDKLRGQIEFIEDLPRLKARKTVAIKALTQKLINTPIQRWGVSLTQQFEGLGNKLQRAILRRKEKEGN